jgi:SlyX protein
MTDLTEDIVELQTRVQFQEDTIHKLDEVVIRQGALLDRMQRKLVELEDRIEQLGYERGAAGRNSPADEKPPHY